MDHLPFGGTCALRGCDPKKMLISGAEAIDMARQEAEARFAGYITRDDCSAPAGHPPHR
jgi:glutathione reductase (NADPH)